MLEHRVQRGIQLLRVRGGGEEIEAGTAVVGGAKQRQQRVRAGQQTLPRRQRGAVHDPTGIRTQPDPNRGRVAGSGSAWPVRRTSTAGPWSAWT